jgi:hypothetical protein
MNECMQMHIVYLICIHDDMEKLLENPPEPLMVLKGI